MGLGFGVRVGVRVWVRVGVNIEVAADRDAIILEGGRGDN